MIAMWGERPVEMQVHSTPTACAGAATAYLLRRIAFRAGAYAPGIQDEIFDELTTTANGATFCSVDRWFTRRAAELQRLGYRVGLHRANRPTDDLAAWAFAGRGYRGAVLATRYDILYPGAETRDGIEHAVGLLVEAAEAGNDGELVTIDPWARGGRARAPLSRTLEPAHRACDDATLSIFWTGWR